MKPEEILRIVDAIHRDKNIDKEIVFQAIEAAWIRPNSPVGLGLRRPSR